MVDNGGRIFTQNYLSDNILKFQPPYAGHPLCVCVCVCVCNVVCHMTGPQPLPKRVLHTVGSSVSSFNFQYPILFLRSSSSHLCLLLPHLPVTSIFPSTFSLITCCRKQFLCKIIQVAILLFIVCRIFLSSLILCNTSSFFTQFVQMIFSILLLHHISKLQCISDLLSEVSKFQHHMFQM